MAAGNPTILDPYLPSGIDRLVVFPRPPAAVTVLAIDISAGMRNYYATYPGSIADLDAASVEALAERLTSLGVVDLHTVRGLSAQVRARTAGGRRYHAGQFGRWRERHFEHPNGQKISVPAASAVTAFFATGLIALPFGLGFWTLVPMAVIGLGTFVGIHLTGMWQVRKDEVARIRYDKALKADEGLFPLSALPDDLVGTIGRIDHILKELRSYGLSTDDRRTAATQEIETLIRATHDEIHHGRELAELDKILKGVAQEDILHDHELVRAADHRSQHLAKRNDAAGRADRAFRQLLDLAEAAAREARAVQAKIAATARLSEKPEPE